MEDNTWRGLYPKFCCMVNTTPMEWDILPGMEFTKSKTGDIHVYILFIGIYKTKQAMFVFTYYLLVVVC